MRTLNGVIFQLLFRSLARRDFDGKWSTAPCRYKMSPLIWGCHWGLIRVTVIMTYNPGTVADQNPLAREDVTPFFLHYEKPQFLLLLLHCYIVCNKHWLSNIWFISNYYSLYKNSMITVEKFLLFYRWSIHSLHW